MQGARRRRRKGDEQKLQLMLPSQTANFIEEYCNQYSLYPFQVVVRAIEALKKEEGKLYDHRATNQST